MKITLEDEDGNEIKLPTKRIVCPRCDGTGVHDHPAFSNGFSQEDFDEDPDFKEDYFRGRCDVACEECGGRNVVEVPDEERMSPELVSSLHKRYEEEASYRAEQEAERRMGA